MTPQQLKDQIERQRQLREASLKSAQMLKRAADSKKSSSPSSAQPAPVEEGSWDIRDDGVMRYIPSAGQLHAREARCQTAPPKGAPIDAHRYIETSNGALLWLDDEYRLHRHCRLPAHISKNSDCSEYLEHGLHHNLYGPAASDMFYYIRGKQLSKADFQKHPEVLEAMKENAGLRSDTTLRIQPLKFSAKRPPAP